MTFSRGLPPLTLLTLLTLWEEKNSERKVRKTAAFEAITGYDFERSPLTHGRSSTVPKRRQGSSKPRSQKSSGVPPHSVNSVNSVTLRAVQGKSIANCRAAWR